MNVLYFLAFPIKLPELVVDKDNIDTTTERNFFPHPEFNFPFINVKN